MKGNISLHIIPCIVGYKLVKDEAQYSCKCNLDIEHILQCENDQVAILLNVSHITYTINIDEYLFKGTDIVTMTMIFIIEIVV